jgi:hypothetical protein
LETRGGRTFAAPPALEKKKLEHDPEKWIPVFRKDHAQSKSQSDNRFNMERLRSMQRPGSDGG